MTKTEAIALAGSLSALSKVLGITPAAVSQWKSIPELRLMQLKNLKPDWFNDRPLTSTDGNS